MAQTNMDITANRVSVSSATDADSGELSESVNDEESLGDCDNGSNSNGTKPFEVAGNGVKSPSVSNRSGDASGCGLPSLVNSSPCDTPWDYGNTFTEANNDNAEIINDNGEPFDDNVNSPKDNVISLKDNVIPLKDNVNSLKDNVNSFKDNNTSYNHKANSLNDNVTPSNDHLNTFNENVNLLGENVNLLGENVNLIGENDNLLGENIHLVGENANPLEANSNPFKEIVSPLKDRVNPFKDTVHPIKEKVKTINDDLETMKPNVQAINQNVQAINQNVQAINQNAKTIIGNVKSINQNAEKAETNSSNGTKAKDTIVTVGQEVDNNSKRGVNNAQRVPKPNSLEVRSSDSPSHLRNTGNREKGAKETDSLLSKELRSYVISPTNVKNGIRKGDSPDEEKPVLHVQFDSERRESDATATVKDPCSSSSSSLSSSSGSSSEETIEISEARPPDGGWGWVIVAASFVVNLVADGITFSFGVIFVEFLKYFGENRGKTAWIGSLFMAMPLLSGPVASFLTDRYGCRKVTMVGSFLACTGFVISSRANSMEVLFVTFGVLAGFGLSLCYVASVVIVAYYFDKKRSFATGLAVCGSGIGTFIFAPLTQALLDEFGWRGTTLILAGLFLNLAVCGALMRDLPWTSTLQKTLAKERKRNRSMKRKKNGSSADTFSISNSTNTASAAQPLAEADKDKEMDSNADRLSCSLVNLPTFVRNGEKVPIEVIELLSSKKNVYNAIMHNYPNLLTPSRSFSDSGRLNEVHLQPKEKFKPIPSPLATDHATMDPSTNQTNPDDVYVSWLKKNKITPPRLHQKKLQTAYLKDLRVHRLSLTYRGAMLNINRYRLRASSCPDIYRNSMTTIAKEKMQWYSGLWDFWDIVVDMFDFSHFADTKFLAFALSNFLLYTWYDVPYVYLADNAIEMGFSDKDSSMLISIIGIVNMFGEIILGWAGDQPWINAGIIYAVCMGLCGGITALVPLLKSYTLLCAASGAFGLFIAANYSLTCIILVELITLEKFTNAYGLLLLVQGIANLIGPPLGGWLYDITGTYDLSFYLAGFFIAVSGLLLVILPATKRYRRFQTLQRQVSVDSSIRGDASPKEPKFHNILASCITGRVVKNTLSTENHV